MESVKNISYRHKFGSFFCLQEYHYYKLNGHHFRKNMDLVATAVMKCSDEMVCSSINPVLKEVAIFK